MKKTRIAIIIPSYNRRIKTLRCLKSLSNITSGEWSYSIILVDDGSSDGTVESVADEFPEITILHGTGNLFWAGTVNVGICYAIEADIYNYILILNDDTVHDACFLDEMLSVAKLYSNAIIGAKILYLSDLNKIRFAGAKWDIFRYGWFYPNDMSTSESVGIEPFEVESINGNCCLIPTNLFKKLGMYDQSNLPHYYADSMFTILAKKSGSKLIISPNACVWDDDSDIVTRVYGPVINGMDLIRHVFIEKKSAYYWRAFFYFSLFSAPNKFEGMILYLYRMIRISMRVLLSLIGLRSFYSQPK